MMKYTSFTVFITVSITHAHTDNLECLSDVHIVSKKLFLIQGDRPQMMNWERYGLRIGVFEGSLSSEETAEAAVVALVGGDFKFPDNTVVVSAVYAVSLSRPLFKPLRLEIQHCVDLSRGVNPKYLKFAIAPVDTPSLPYQFSIVEGGEFSAGEWYGSINREKFCLVSIVGSLTNGVEGEQQGADEQEEQQEGGDNGEHQNGVGGGGHDQQEEGGDQEQQQQEDDGQQNQQGGEGEGKKGEEREGQKVEAKGEEKEEGDNVKES